jgi:hypothetical protein
MDLDNNNNGNTSTHQLSLHLLATRGCQRLKNKI